MKFPARFRFLLICAALLPFTVRINSAADLPGPPVDPKDLPRVPATEPDAATNTFRVRPGFQVQLAAAEPLVADPVALSFDENGRLFVVEMRDYSERRDERLGRIRLLEDTDGDGRFDKSTVFAEDLPWPTGVICYHGGVFVAATPDLIYLKDTNGDGVADEREVVFTGFGAGVTRLNVQQLFNSLTWGLNNRIHGANGGNGGTISSLRHPEEKPLELRGRDFSFDPRTMTIRAESGGGQYGLSFDDRGRKFVCSNSSHIRAVMYDERYAGRNPHFTLPAPSLDIAVDGPAAEVYRISPDEPWRVIRTRWRVSGVVPGLIEGGGRPSGYFTGATGIMIYRGDSWPEEFRGDAFVADCGSNLVHRKKIYAEGVALKAQRPPDEEHVEFLASRDNWFRPVQMANGPDGNLYVIDMYREVIEHPWSLPPSLKEHLDLNSGNTRGRIYRIVPEGFKAPHLPQLGTASVAQLVAALEQPNGWTRDTAARLLYEAQRRGAVPELKRLLASSPSPIARMHALYALEGMGALEEAQIEKALDDASEIVREHALRLGEPAWSARALEPRIADRLAQLAHDRAPRVCYQLAFTLGSVAHPNRVALLEQIVRAHAEDSWIQVAVLNSSDTDSSELFARLANDGGFGPSAAAESFLAELARIVGARNRRDELSRTLASIGTIDSTARACALGNALAEGMQRAGASLSAPAFQGQFGPLLRRAHVLLQDSHAATAARLAALSLVGRGPFADARAPLRAMLQPNEPAEFQKAAIRALASFPDHEVVDDLLEAWNGLTPSQRPGVIDALLRRSERVNALLNALESGRIARADLSASQVALLRKRDEPSVQARVDQLLGGAPAGTRQDVVRAYREALQLAGNAARGEAIYEQRCSSCHRLGGRGFALGPDLETVRAAGKESLLTNLLDPNREVMLKYVNYLAETKDGESYTGLISQESETGVVLRQPSGNEVTLQRANLQQLRSLGQSAMPEGLEAGLSQQDVADLMEFVLSAQPKTASP